MQRTISTLVALLVGIAAPARAEDDPGDTPLYLGQKNHVKIELGVGLSGSEDSDLLSLQPTIEGRFGIGESLGIQAVIPMMWVDVSSDLDDDNRFDIGNPTVALEVLLDPNPRAIKLVRAGVALPLLTIEDPSDFGDLKDLVLQAVNVMMAWGSNGFFDMWRYAPDTLSVFGELQGTLDVEGMFVDFRAGAGILIPTSDDSDTEVAVQALGRVGFGNVVRPFLGLGMVFIPTEAEGLSGDEDAFQFGVQGGAIFELGSARLDAMLQVNIDRPAGFSFDDDGVFGIHVGATIPF